MSLFDELKQRIASMGNGLSNAGFNRHFFDADVTRNTFQQFPQAAQRNPVTRYVQNQVVEPITRGIAEAQVNNSLKGSAGRTNVTTALSALPALQGAFNATPAGVVWNARTAAATGITNAIRTGNYKGAGGTTLDAFTDPTSFAEKGLGVTNPYAQMVIDTLAGNPRGLLAGGRTLSTVGKSKTLVEDAGKIVKAGAQVAGFKGPGTTLKQDIQSIRNGAKSLVKTSGQSHPIYQSIQKATEYDPTFKKTLDDIAAASGYRVQHGPVKTAERALQKVTEDYGGDISKLKDLNRSTLVLDPPQFEEALKNLSGKFSVDRVKNNFDAPPGEFKKIIVNIKTPAGTGEIQLTTPEMTEAKEILGGHKLYEKVRSKVADWEKFEVEMQQLYREAEGKTAARLNSSSETAVPSARALNGENGRPVAVIPNTSSVDGSRATLTNTSLTSKNAGNGSFIVSPNNPSVPQKRQFVQSKTGSTGNPLEETLVDNNPTLNVNRLNISPEAKLQASELIDANKAKITAAPGKKLTNKEAIAASKISNKTLTKVVGRDQTKEWEAALINTRQLLSKQAKEGKVTPEYLQNLTVLKSLASDTARKLQSFGINADPQDITPMQNILSDVLKVNDNVDEVLRAADGVDFNDAKQAAEFYRKFIKPNAGNWLDTLRYNSMLSSPNTHINNAFGSNLPGSAIIKPIEKTVTGVVDFVGSAITGKERKAFVGEGPAYAKGYWSNVGKAFSNFADVLSGKSDGTNLDTRSIPLATKGLKGAAYNTLSFPMKALEAADQFFAAMAEGGEKAALNLRIRKGIKVGDIDSIAKENAAYTLYRQDLGNSKQGYVLDAIDQLTGNLQKLRNNENPLVSTIAKFTVPFVRTPMNIFKQGLEYSPAGITTIPGAKNVEEQIAKAVIGTTVFAGASTLLGSGRLTWGEPTGEAEKNAFKAAHMQPYSMKIGDKWYSFTKLPPSIAFPFAMVAAIDDAEKNKKLDQSTTEQILAGVAKYGDFLADQSYAKSIGDILGAARGTSSGIARAVGNYPQQLVPFRALTGWMARMTDNTSRKVADDAGFIDKQVQLLMMQYPGLSKQAPARLDSSGNPITTSDNITNAFSPVRVSTENPTGKLAYNLYKENQKQNQEQSAETKKIKLQIAQAYKSQDQESLNSLLAKLPKAEQTSTLKSLVQDTQIKGLDPITAQLASMSKGDRAAMIAQHPEYAPLLNQIPAAFLAAGSTGGSTNLTMTKLKKMKSPSKGRRGRKAKIVKYRAPRIQKLKTPKKLSAPKVSVKKISLTKKYG